MALPTHFDAKTARRLVAAAHQVEDWQSSGRGERGRRLITAQRSDIQMAIMIGFESPNNRWVNVVEPVPSQGDPWDGRWVIPAREAVPIWCWPPLRAVDYSEFILEGGQEGEEVFVTDDADVLPAVRRHGVWVVLPMIMFGVTPYPRNVPYSDCTPTSTTP